VQALLVDFNALVKKGDVIARIDPQLFEATRQMSRANVFSAEGGLDRSKAQAAQAQLELARVQKLFGQALVSQAEVDTAASAKDAALGQVKQSEGALAQARAALSQAELNLALTTIHSPIDGVVISRNVDVGQTVAASLSAPTLFVIAEDLRTMQVDTSVSEGDVGKLSNGLEASFTVDAWPRERFKGVVRQIRNAPQTVQNVVTYDAVLDVDNAGLKLRPGMTANVTFVHAEKDGVVRVPNAALRFRPPPGLNKSGGAAPSAEQGRLAVPAADGRPLWVLGDDGAPRPVRVKTGLSDGTLTEVLEGLKPGDTIVTEAISLDPAPAAAPGQMGGSGGLRRAF